MPTNLPAEYYTAEERFKAAATPAEKIETLEAMISTIPKHKGTDHLRADLRRKLSKLREATEGRKGGGRQLSPYQIDREGAGQVAVIGPPNVGKSSLVAALTNAAPEVAEYPFTTRFPLPGMMPIDNVSVQLIDTPPLSVEAVEPQLIDLIRRADLLLLVVDLQGFPIEQIEETLALLEENRILADFRQAGHPGADRLWVRPLRVLANKADDPAHDEDYAALCELMDDPCPIAPVSAATGRHFDRLKGLVYDELGIMRVYARPPGKEPDYGAPFVLKRGDTVEEFAAKVHRDFVVGLKSARVWGSGVHDGQMVGRDHVLHEGDVVELRV